jgi:hypothetical protein
VHEGGGSGFEGRHLCGYAVISGEEDDPHPRINPSDGRRGVRAVAVWKVKIEDGDIRREIGCLSPRPSHRFRAAHDDHVRLRAEQAGEPIRHQLVVFHHENADSPAGGARRCTILIAQVNLVRRHVIRSAAQAAGLVGVSAIAGQVPPDWKRVTALRYACNLRV